MANNNGFEIKRPVLIGDTADVFLQRSLTILRNEGVNPEVTVEFAPESGGVLCGISEVKSLLSRILPETGSEVWALEDGEQIGAREVVLRIKAPYSALGLYETAIPGILAHSTGWATAARECVDAARGTPVISIGANNIHPNVSANMDYASVKGGCVSCSTTQGARLAGVTPSGNMPHALNLLIGDTVKAIEAFDRHLPQEVPRLALVDTFRYEIEEAINVASSLKQKLRGIRLDATMENQRVTPALVNEVRARLDLAGFNHVEIMVSGNITAKQIHEFSLAEAPVDSFGIGAPIAIAPPNPFTMEIHEVDGKPVARRGSLPGISNNTRLGRVM